MSENVSYTAGEERKRGSLLLVLAVFFIGNALVAEFMGVKIFSLEQTLGYNSVHWNLFGYDLSFQLTAGVLLWPFVFVMTDILNEYFGRKEVHRLSILAAIILVYAFIMVFAAIGAKPADWWVGSKAAHGIPDFNIAYKEVFGQGLGIIAGSLTAFLVGQVADAYIFQKLKLKTGHNAVWIRATGSTMVSQLIDSFVVLYIAFHIWGDWPIAQVIAVGIVNYIYKVTMAFVLLPVLYMVHRAIDKYLGKDLSSRMISDAVSSSSEK